MENPRMCRQDGTSSIGEKYDAHKENPENNFLPTNILPGSHMIIFRLMVYAAIFETTPSEND
jgi:hypothetical protein